MPYPRELVVLCLWPWPHLIVSLCAVELVITEGGGSNREQSTGKHTGRQLAPCQFHCSDTGDKSDALKLCNRLSLVGERRNDDADDHDGCILQCRHIYKAV